ncbi:MAG: inorganic diphosphatase [Metamycoplasmataceae bacterium]
MNNQIIKLIIDKSRTYKKQKGDTLIPQLSPCYWGTVKNIIDNNGIKLNVLICTFEEEEVEIGSEVEVRIVGAIRIVNNNEDDVKIIGVLNEFNYSQIKSIDDIKRIDKEWKRNLLNEVICFLENYWCVTGKIDYQKFNINNDFIFEKSDWAWNEYKRLNSKSK